MPADAALHVQLATALDERGDRAAAAESVGKALYLDRFCEEALVLAARFADARGASAAHGEILIARVVEGAGAVMRRLKHNAATKRRG